jgi:hypothetical protein
VGTEGESGYMHSTSRIYNTACRMCFISKINHTTKSGKADKILWSFG